MSNVGSHDMIVALQDIATAVREATREAKEYRSSKMVSMVEKMQEQLDMIAEGEKAKPSPRGR